MNFNENTPIIKFNENNYLNIIIINVIIIKFLQNVEKRILKCLLTLKHCGKVVIQALNRLLLKQLQNINKIIHLNMLQHV